MPKTILTATLAALIAAFALACGVRHAAVGTKVYKSLMNPVADGDGADDA